MSLFKLLSEYTNSEPVRFHMPGHKGRMNFPNPYEVDVTEFGDFDDLHNPDGAIKHIEDEIATIYKAKSAKLLVNGSTVGVLASIFAMIQENDKVLISRYSHKSIINALILRKAKVIFFKQDIDQNGLAKPVDVSTLESIAKDNNDIKLVIITSPTYEGVVSNIKDIKKVFNTNIPVFVDSAHGAHFGLYAEEFPHPITEGCEIAVTSLHKTMPFFTQSSALLISEKGKQFEKKVQFYLDCFESSSPSYILMAGADKGLELLQTDGSRLFKQYQENLDIFYKRISKLKNIKAIDYEYKDRGKLVITSNSQNAISTIAKELEGDNIFPEMVTTSYILCMTSIMNNSDDFDRLVKCLEKADTKIGVEEKGTLSIKKDTLLTYAIPKYRLPMYEAVDKKISYVPIEEAAGMISGGIIDVFPPGVALLLPGEEIEKQFIGLVKNAKENNINIRGIIDGKIPVI